MIFYHSKIKEGNSGLGTTTSAAALNNVTMLYLTRFRRRWNFGQQKVDESQSIDQ